LRVDWCCIGKDIAYILRFCRICKIYQGGFHGVGIEISALDFVFYAFYLLVISFYFPGIFGGWRQNIDQSYVTPAFDGDERQRSGFPSHCP
jgi:hypothetical protein